VPRLIEKPSGLVAGRGIGGLSFNREAQKNLRSAAKDTEAGR